MCLFRVESFNIEDAEKSGIGYKVIVDEGGKFFSMYVDFYGNHRRTMFEENQKFIKEEIIFGKIYEAVEKKITDRRYNKEYTAGFHTFKKLEDAKKLIEKRNKFFYEEDQKMAIVEVEYSDATCEGIQHGFDNGKTVVSRKIKFLKIIE